VTASAPSLLVLDRGGLLWGVDHAAVTGLERSAAGFRIAVAGGALWADRVLGVARELRVLPPSQVVRRFWGPARGGQCTGVAVYRGEPVVVIDAALPPEALVFEQGEPAHAERHEGR
jgi:hypothetical protein